MGLDTTHDCWHGGYISFNVWRRELARAAGYKVVDEPRLDHAYYDLPWDMFESKNYQGEWDSPPGDDPLLFLLVHSDCDGVIHPQQGIHIARRLEHLLPLLTDGPGGLDAAWMQEKTCQFITGLQKAATAREDVVFA